MIYTTLNRICPTDSYEGGWTKLLRYLGKNKADDEPLPLATIVKAVGVDDAMYYCRNDPQLAKVVFDKAKEYFPAREKAFTDAYGKRYNEVIGTHKEKDASAVYYGWQVHAAVVKAQTADFLRFLEDAA